LIVDQSYLVRFLRPGWFGVQLFFVISGFVLGLPFARRHLHSAPAPNLKSYYLRRVTRIEPPYVICLFVYLLFIYLTRPNWTSFMSNFFASLLYSHNLYYGEPSRIAIIFWSLEIEIQFYLLVPLLAVIFALKNNLLRRSLLVGLIVVWGVFGVYWVRVYSPRLERNLLSYLQYFLAGFLLVEIYLAKLIHHPRKSYAWDVVVVLASIAIFMILDTYGRFRWLLPFAILLLYVSLFIGRTANRFITLKPVFTIGGMCYTLYLYHLLVIEQFGRLTFRLSLSQLSLPLDFLVQCLLLLPIIGGICSLVFYFCEKPFMKKQFFVSDRAKVVSRPSLA